MTDPLDASARALLQWRCRRGMLENDLLIDRFFQRHGDHITARQAQAMSQLMALSDNDLLDLLLSRNEPGDALDSPDVRELLTLLRPAGAARAASAASPGKKMHEGTCS